LSRKPKRAKRAKAPAKRPAIRKVKKLSLAERFAASAEKRELTYRLVRAERERDEANTRLYDLQERLAIREEVPFGTVESTSERAHRVLLRNEEWMNGGGLVRDAYLLPLDTVFGPLELPFWQEAGVVLRDSKARELAELFKLDRRDIYTIYFSP
jgi:hypothetical protein